MSIASPTGFAACRIKISLIEEKELMRIRDSVWQGNFGYWQHGFIQANALVIGYYAWKGYLAGDRGIVVCEIAAEVTESRITSLDLVPFSSQFMVRSQLDCLQNYGLDQDAIAQLLPVVETYNPCQDVLLLLSADQQIEVSLLQNFAVTPPECYEQVGRRWEEFQLCSLQ
ncbi:MAG TPA: hypothetical protein V6C57_16310 [Coleofasciculaceae cyanobacterium]